MASTGILGLRNKRNRLLSAQFWCRNGNVYWTQWYHFMYLVIVLLKCLKINLHLVDITSLQTVTCLSLWNMVGHEKCGCLFRFLEKNWVLNFQKNKKDGYWIEKNKKCLRNLSTEIYPKIRNIQYWKFSLHFL